MEKTNINTIAAWSEGILNAHTEAYVTDAVIDSREACEGSLFFCIKGKNDDGHKYVDEVRKNGGYSIGEEKNCDIIVGSTIKALGDIAREYRKTINPVIIAVTGSNGKTTTTKMISSILEEDYALVSTPKSFNNHIGLPVTILKMDRYTQIGVLEMGANHVGEIKYLCNIACPKVAVVTNVGDAHIGYFGSREEILNTKFEIAESLPGEGILMYNYDQEDVRTKALEYSNRFNIIGFGMNPEADVSGKIMSINEDSSIFEVDDNRIQINMPGSFNVYNSMAAISAVKSFETDMEKISRRLKNIEKLPHRMQNIKINGIEILDDSYNASPASVKKVFCELLKIYPQKNIIAVVGDMLELGEYSDVMHRDIGEFIAGIKNIKYLLTGGKYADCVINGALKKGLEEACLYKFKNGQEAAKIIMDIWMDNSLVVLKASRQQNLERIIEYLSK